MWRGVWIVDSPDQRTFLGSMKQNLNRRECGGEEDARKLEMQATISTDEEGMHVGRTRVWIVEILVDVKMRKRGSR